MAIDFGTVKPGRTLYVPFDSFAGSTGASITLTGLAVTDIEIYKDGSTTQRSSDNGYTLLDTDGIDFDGLTGIHGFSINLADNSDAGFYAAGSRYFVVVSSVTVDSQTVSFVACTFSIGQPDAVLNTTIATLASQTSFTLTDGPAEDDALNDCWLMIHDVSSAVQMAIGIVSDYTGATKTVTLAAAPTFTIAATDNIAVMGPMPMQPTVAARKLDVSSGGEAGLDWANIGSKTTTNDLNGTTISTSQAVASVSGAVGSVTGNVGGNVTGSVGSVVGAVGSVTGNVGGNVTGSVGSVVGAVGSVTGNVGGNVTGSVGSVAAGGITASSFAADAITAAKVASDVGTEIAAAVLSGGDIDGYTLEQAQKIQLASAAGKLSGAATTTVAIRAADDSKDRITATVDASGNRTAVTLDGAG